MRLGVGKWVIGQNNSQGAQRQETGESKMFCLRLVIIRSHWKEVVSGGENNPASALAQPPALKLSGPHPWGTLQ